MPAPSHSAKRRRLSNPSSHVQPPTTSKLITASDVKSIPNPICISCHRSLNSTQGYLILCARCSKPTCAICSRTCAASNSSSAPPPIPDFLSLSTPSSRSSSTWPSPCRVALALTFTTNTPPPPTSSSPLTPNTASPRITLGKRRKPTEDIPATAGDLSAGGQENLDCMGGANNSIAGVAEQKTVDGAEATSTTPTSPGCGRTVCRNCCYEDFKQSTVTCYNCSPP